MNFYHSSAGICMVWPPGFWSNTESHSSMLSFASAWFKSDNLHGCSISRWSHSTLHVIEAKPVICVSVSMTHMWPLGHKPFQIDIYIFVGEVWFHTKIRQCALTLCPPTHWVIDLGVGGFTHWKMMLACMVQSTPLGLYGLVFKKNC